MGEDERDFEGLDADEREICTFLVSWRDQLVSGTEIARRAAGRKRFQEDPKWAGQALARLVEKGFLESDSRDHYRLRTNQLKKTSLELPREPQVRSCEGKKILFVDDDEGWRTIVAAFLEDAGANVLTARDATDALAQAEGVRLDLVILDLNLDGESGLELMKFVKRNHPDVPVILYTGQIHDDDTILAMLRQGALQYVRKGPLEELRQVLEMALKR
jgi:CheY-like chemotaxis protein